MMMSNHEALEKSILEAHGFLKSGEDMDKSQESFMACVYYLMLGVMFQKNKRIIEMACVNIINKIIGRDNVIKNADYFISKYYEVQEVEEDDDI